MTPSRLLFSQLAAAALLTLTACGGSSTPVAGTLAYADPAGGDYRLRRNAALSTPTHLVLDLWGPATTGSGVSLSLATDAARTAWANVAATDPAGTWVQNGTQLQLGAAPRILKAAVAGAVLKATAAQKGAGSPVSLDGPLLRVALDLKPGAAAGAVTLTADQAGCRVLDATGTIAPITVSVGTLTAQ